MDPTGLFRKANRQYFASSPPLAMRLVQRLQSLPLLFDERSSPKPKASAWN
ncbi:unnamed protein product [Dovyalis caffra]|uniref:Uncharacterized protein n=1 Tax=Dovyalis caffra TaxID=77055 RepID=A0AAV1SUN5_9ROSI|nr:unnamed protein product [Dovyalis caffra]